MATAWRGTGTEAHASSGSITPTQPSGGNAPQSGDTILIFAENGNNDVLASSGYTLKDALNIDANARINLWYKIAAGSDANPSITGALADVQANIMVFSGTVTSGDPINALSKKANTVASTTVDADAITPTTAGSMIVFFGCQYDLGSAVSTFSGYSGTNPTFTEGFDNNFMGSTINTSIFGAYGSKTDTTTTGNRTATATSSLKGGTFLIALTPAGGATIVLKRNSSLNGLGASGSFFHDPLAKSYSKQRGFYVPNRKIFIPSGISL